MITKREKHRSITFQILLGEIEILHLHQDGRHFVLLFDGKAARKSLAFLCSIQLRHSCVDLYINVSLDAKHVSFIPHTLCWLISRAEAYVYSKD